MDETKKQLSVFIKIPTQSEEMAKADHNRLVTHRRGNDHFGSANDHHTKGVTSKQRREPHSTSHQHHGHAHHHDHGGAERLVTHKRGNEHWGSANDPHIKKILARGIREGVLAKAEQNAPRSFESHNHNDEFAAEMYSENQYHSWGKHLSPQELHGIKTYASKSYVHINNPLRGIHDYKHDDAQHYVDEAKAAIPHIDSALSKNKTAMPHGLILHRGVSGEYGTELHHAIQSGQLGVGSHIHNHGYTSTSLFPHHAREFVDGERAAGNSKHTAEMRIHAPLGTIGSHIDHTAFGHPARHEFLLPRDRVFRVDHIEQHPKPDGGMHYVIHQTIANHDHHPAPYKPE